MPEPQNDLFTLIRAEHLPGSTYDALGKLDASAQARLASRIEVLIEKAVGGRLEAAPTAERRAELWWIVSRRNEPWAGLQMASFTSDQSGHTQVFIFHETDARRIGIRDWAFIQEAEGWEKVERIPHPRVLDDRPS